MIQKAFYCRSFFQYIPNILTMLRVLAVPAIVFLIFDDYFFWAFLIFAAASITDFVDGYLARRWRVESTLGRLLDPLADKSLLVCCFLTLGYKGLLPLWVVLLVISRDVLIIAAGLSVYLFHIPMVLKPSWGSKVNTVAQIFLIGGMLILQGCLSFQGVFFYSSFIIPFLRGILFVILWITAITTVWSGMGYGIDFGRQAILRFKAPRKK